MPNLRSLPVAALAVSLLLPAAAAQPQRTPEQYAAFLESPDRVARLQVPRVVQTLRLETGARVADLGAGSGLFARELARAVGPTGRVYAIDIDPALLTIVEARAKAEGLANVQPVQASADTPNIPEPVDLVFMADALHHLPQPPAYLKRLRGSLKPGGRIAVIDFTDRWPPGHEAMRYTVDDLDRWMKDAGLKRLELHDFIEGNFFAVYG
jgi:ubiquinone/menaquinone biosynthesis C-methylase UbiE